MLVLIAGLLWVVLYLQFAVNVYCCELFVCLLVFALLFDLAVFFSTVAVVCVLRWRLFIFINWSFCFLAVNLFLGVGVGCGLFGVFWYVT